MPRPFFSHLKGRSLKGPINCLESLVKSQAMQVLRGGVRVLVAQELLDQGYRMSSVE